MKQAIAGALRRVVRTSERVRWAGVYSRVHDNVDPQTHIREAVDWLMRAQDAGDNRGVSYGTRFGSKRFMESYPETTGYIIQTFVELARHYEDPLYLRRAIEMGDWEIEIQMPCGAVMGGMYDDKNPTPAVFNTGQVMLGWAALFNKTGEQRFVEAGRRAARWLISMQEADGNWIRGNSAFAASTTVYNVKSAWGLLEIGLADKSDETIQGAIRNAEFCLTKQTANGWFSDCCLSDATQPLLHTIAYTLQGLVNIGILARKEDFVQAATKTADAMLNLMDENGFIPGRIDDAFRGGVDWCCLTGTAQMSIVWSQLHEITRKDAYRQAAVQANRYLMARHDITSEDPTIRGAVPGSWPVWGDYGRLSALNWAAKFFVDALLLELKHRPTATPPDRG